MTWNWQQPDWPSFTFDSSAMEALERHFLVQSGEVVGAAKHMGADDKETLRIELISNEAIKTSEIEGEILDRASVQSSLRQQFGIGNEQASVRPAERGIANMMVDLYRNYASALSDQTLREWHAMLLADDKSVGVIGGYRTHTEPMQVVSGPDYKRKIHFEAPPSVRVAAEMKRFVKWFNNATLEGKCALPALTRAGIAHHYFVSIHPFEDGNGRIARALAEKSLAQSLSRPSLIALAYTIGRKRNDYYAALARNNRSNQITDWLIYFGNTIVEAQSNTLDQIDFHVSKAKLYQRLHGQLNERQEKVIARMFREGIDGFRGGLTAEKYVGIGRTSRATATRDLADLVAKRALIRTGALRYTRYHLSLDPASSRLRGGAYPPPPTGEEGNGTRRSRVKAGTVQRARKPRANR